MAKMLAGSEGTLAVFTKITLRTVTLPPAKALLQIEFKRLEKIAKAVPIIVETGACACELMDKNVIEMAIESFPEYKDILPAGAEAVLLVEQSGQFFWLNKAGKMNGKYVKESKIQIRLWAS
jgi:FAD/FMN-containing dehydrogenase